MQDQPIQQLPIDRALSVNSLRGGVQPSFPLPVYPMCFSGDDSE